MPLLQPEHSLSPIVDILKANFEIQDNDTDQQIRQKVSSFLKIIRVDEPSTLPYLLELLSVKESGIEKMQMSPEARKDRTLKALKKITLKGSELRPLIMAVETSIGWTEVRGCLEGTPGEHLRIEGLSDLHLQTRIYSYLGNRSYHSQVTLNKLSNRESLAMVSYLLNSTNVDKDIEDLTLSKAEASLFYRGVHQVPQRAEDHRQGQRHIQTDQGPQSHLHPLDHPGCDHGPCRSSARGSPGSIKNRLRHRAGVQP